MNKTGLEKTEVRPAEFLQSKESRIHQISNRKTQPLYLLFVDLTAAFDHIPRD